MGTVRDAPESADGRYGIRSISLAFRILEALAAAKGPMGVTELGRELDTNKWRVFRHLHTLRAEGYVTQDPASSRFELGTRLYNLAAALPRRFDFTQIARPVVLDLQRAIDHTIILSGIVNGDVVVLDSQGGDDPVQIAVIPGTKLELHATASGKVALAFGPPALLEAALSRPLAKHSSRTITDPETLRQEVARIRAQGVAFALEERRAGVNFIAAPLFSAGKTFEGSIGFLYLCSGGKPGTPPPAKEVKALRDAAATISRMLGDG